MLVNLSASNEVIGKAGYRRQLVVGQSGRCIAGYVYASCGVGESTTDLVFGGHCLIAENGALLAESRALPPRRATCSSPTSTSTASATTACGRTASATRRRSARPPFRRVAFDLELTPREPEPAARASKPHPFVPRGPGHAATSAATRSSRRRSPAWRRRLEHIGTPPVAIGVSGGLDSTLALLVACKTMDDLGVPRDRVQALTMPGFGTTSRTKGNAHALMQPLGVTVREIDIRPLCFEEMKALGHAPFGITLDGETVEALTREAAAPAAGAAATTSSSRTCRRACGPACS